MGQAEGHGQPGGLHSAAGVRGSKTALELNQPSPVRFCCVSSKHVERQAWCFFEKECFL